MDFKNDSVEDIIAKLRHEINQVDLLIASHDEEKKMLDRIDEKAAYLKKLAKEDLEGNLNKILRMMRLK